MWGRWIRSGLALLVLASLACSDDDPVKPAPCVPADDLTPQLQLKDLDGQDHDIRDQICNNMVLLDFGATWCPPCGRGLPSMQELHETYGDAGLRVVAVNVQEETEVVLQYFSDKDFTFPVLLDLHGNTARAWDVKAIPTYVLVSRKGEEIARVVGFDAGRIEDLKAEIQSRLMP